MRPQQIKVALLGLRDLEWMAQGEPSNVLCSRHPAPVKAIFVRREIKKVRHLPMKPSHAVRGLAITARQDVVHVPLTRRAHRLQRTLHSLLVQPASSTFHSGRHGRRQHHVRLVRRLPKNIQVIFHTLPVHAKF